MAAHAAAAPPGPPGVGAGAEHNEHLATYEYADHVFDRFDTDHNGVLDKKEFGRLVAAVSARMGVTDPPSESEVDALLVRFDTNHDGKISKDEFAVMVNELFPTVSV